MIFSSTANQAYRMLRTQKIQQISIEDLMPKMEALAHDLTLALEESSKGTNVRRRWGIRRRARSTGNISTLSLNKHSDDSSSSVCDVRIPRNTPASKYQSDSDETSHQKRFARFSNLNNISNIESDSVNENFAPRTNTRRKRKFKRMAVESDSHPSTSRVIIPVPSAVGKKKKVFRNDCENRFTPMWCGKRKRSCRERSTDCEMRPLKPQSLTKSKNVCKEQKDEAMDCSRLSSSSISSSDSEAGIITNDEDREGDDEQSDWIGDSNWWEDGDSANDEKGESMYQSVLLTNPEYRQRIGLNGREIRAGCRQVDNKPGYSIITSANEKVSRFLQDPNKSELKLHPMRQPERDKLRCLANLYSLGFKGDLSCPVLYKTRHTTQAICVDQVSLNRYSDYKRLRKTPPNSPNTDSQSNETLEQNNIEQLVAQPAVSYNLSNCYYWAQLQSESQKKSNHNFAHSKSS